MKLRDWERIGYQDGREPVCLPHQCGWSAVGGSEFTAWLRGWNRARKDASRAAADPRTAYKSLSAR